jgi:L-fuconolactonase
MQKIDAHQHFWKFDPVRDSWITEDMAAIRKDFLPSDLEPMLKQNGFNGCVVVQSDQSEMENAFLLQLAEENNFIKGVVGWVDLQHPHVEERLSYYRRFEKMKGFRHVLQGEAKRDLMLQPEFKRGIGRLNKFGFTYDILVFPDQLDFIKELVVEFPDQRFIIDHLAKPYIKFRKISEWRTDMNELAQFENVWCKVSGMVTEADWKTWSPKDFHPYMDVVVEAFGVNRILFGSDWPVCLIAADYTAVLDIVADYFSAFSKHEQEKIFGNNAVEFYKL